jgi:hypothetical protein
MVVHRRLLATSIVAAFLGVVVLPAAALAQSGIAGVVKDSSGGVLPGVSVEAASPVLIEKTRTVVTDDQGRYSIVDVRPGVYRVTFTLAGFVTLVREGIDLPSNFTATVNADLKVGGLEETMTVTAASPIVDIQNASKTTDLQRDVLDAVPQGRQIQQEGAMAVGVKVSLLADGGARTPTLQRLTVHGSVDTDTTLEVDGVKLNAMLSGGATIQSPNEMMTQEVVVQTSSPPADTSAGGVLLNLIPREGGNTFNGNSYLGYSGRSMQSANLTPALQAQGLSQGDAVDYVYDVNLAVGGPIRRDRLWFLASGREVANANIVANSFYPDGRPGLADQAQLNLSGRLTAQLSPRNKLTVFYDRPYKSVGHVYTDGNTDVLTASQRATDVLYFSATARWTFAVSNKLLIDVSWGANTNNINRLYQPGIAQLRGTPAWYSTVEHQDLVTGKFANAAGPTTVNYPEKRLLNSSVSYVTGSHAFKAGINFGDGPFRVISDMNGDLIQRYRSGVPDSVTVYNTPTSQQDYLNADLGIYVQDTWTLKRLTINPGIRFEYFNGSIDPIQEPAGRFVPFRSFPGQSNAPNFFNVAPRSNVAYDLTGDGKTAIKFGVNKYENNSALNFAMLYDPAGMVTDTRNWTPVDGSAVAQWTPGCTYPSAGCDIGPSNFANFGSAAVQHADPNIKRPYQIQYNAGVDRQLTSTVAVGAAWFRRDAHDLTGQTNTLVSLSDYTPFQIPNPLGNGEVITVYNLNKAKQGLSNLVNYTDTNRSLNRQTYNGFELNFSARLPHKARVLGGWSADQTVTVACDGSDPNTLRNCDQSALHIPFTHDMKIVATVPLVFGFQLGTVLQSYAGAPQAVNDAIPASAYPGGQRTQSETINLIAPGSKYLPQINQWDLNVRKVFKMRRVQADASLDFFNVLNTSVVLAENQNFGSSLGLPTQIFTPRLLRISSSLKF